MLQVPFAGPIREEQELLGRFLDLLLAQLPLQLKRSERVARVY